MTETKIRLIICLACAALWIAESVVFSLRIRSLKKQLAAVQKEIPSAESRLLSVMIISVIVIVLPFLIRFDSLLVTAIIEACGVMAAYVGLKERLDALNSALQTS